MIVALTSEQEERLRRAARSQGVDADSLLRRLVDTALDHLAPGVEPAASRIPGLHAGQYRVPDDFDAPLSDGFWLGAE